MDQVLMDLDHMDQEPEQVPPPPQPPELPPQLEPLEPPPEPELQAHQANTELVLHTELQAAVLPALNQVPHTDKEPQAAFPHQLVANLQLEPATHQATKEPPEPGWLDQVQETQDHPTHSKPKDLEIT